MVGLMTHGIEVQTRKLPNVSQCEESIDMSSVTSRRQEGWAGSYVKKERYPNIYKTLKNLYYRTFSRDVCNTKCGVYLKTWASVAPRRPPCDICITDNSNQRRTNILLIVVIHGS